MADQFTTTKTVGPGKYEAKPQEDESEESEKD